jgi:hypothetical protein
MKIDKAPTPHSYVRLTLRLSPSASRQALSLAGGRTAGGVQRSATLDVPEYATLRETSWRKAKQQAVSAVQHRTAVTCDPDNPLEVVLQSYFNQ